MFKTFKKVDAFAQQAIPYQNCIAKTYLAADEKKYVGRTVLEHCHIVGVVAQCLIERTPKWLQEIFFPIGSILVASTHDVGKVSPYFQEKIYRGTFYYVNNSKIELKNISDPSEEKDWGGHAGVSLVTVKEIKAGKFIPEIVGQHHGSLPNLGGRGAFASVFGGENWKTEREALITELKKLLKCDWPVVRDEVQASVLSGLTTVADWIGSGSYFEDPAQAWQTKVQIAVDNSGFVQPKLKKDLNFDEIFGFKPIELQNKFIENITGPGVYILEAPMGLGKTEAALFAAYFALTRHQSTGIYFALPTQLTSDKIYERFSAFLGKILASDCIHKKAILLHGNAWLQQTEMGEEGQPGASWFEAGKRGILAPFAVGTIDQALMAVMNVKHGFVRAFGLAGKVVILDEVHTYDAYTGTLLDELVLTLKKLHCTVIILSATLTEERREKFLRHKTTNKSYPLISTLSNNNVLNEIAPRPLENKQVEIYLLNNEAYAIEEALLRAEQKQQVLWIENTVVDAQRIYKLLAAKAAEMNVECGLLHSRFIKKRRSVLETYWVDIFGKNNNEVRKGRGRILIGTQVLEQSLDIDADFLITRICPTDMLLQRIGRLWRHIDTYRPSGSNREAWILSPELDQAIADAEKAFEKTAKVYNPYVLCRTLMVWQALSSISLPKDIRCLIEATYCPQKESGNMRKYQDDLEEKHKQLSNLALFGVSKIGTTLSDNKIPTRYSEQNTVQVLLCKSYKNNIAKLLDDTVVNLLPRKKINNKLEWKKNAIHLMKNTLSVPEHLAPKAIPIKQIDALKDYLYVGDDSGAALRVAVLKNDGALVSINGDDPSSKYSIYYDNNLGYFASKK